MGSNAKQEIIGCTRRVPLSIRSLAPYEALERGLLRPPAKRRKNWGRARKNIDKFKNCVIKLNFNNIFITYIMSKGVTDEGMNGFSIW